MKSFMEDVHENRAAATLDSTLLTLKPLDGEDSFQTGAMLNDTCLDWMLECLVRALGSRMLGVKGENCTPVLTINAGLARTHYVLGVAHTDAVQKLVRKKGVDTDHCERPVTHDDCSSWTVPLLSHISLTILLHTIWSCNGAGKHPTFQDRSRTDQSCHQDP
jgi:hypothetical protein